MLGDHGVCVTLIKPHYEAQPALLRKGVLPEEAVAAVVESVMSDIAASGFDLVATVQSPIKGAKGNVEVLAMLKATLS